MKLTGLAALAASFALLLCPVIAAPATAADKSSVEKRNPLLVTTLGGVTFRVKQVPNPRFVGGRSRGPLALARAYAKYGEQIPPQLLATINSIVGRLGLDPGQLGGSLDGGLDNGQPDRGGARPSDSIGRPAEVTRPERPSAVDDTDTADALAEGEGEVVAVPQNLDSQYLCEVQLGTPPQTLTLNLDTGSADLWVFTSDTPRGLITGQTVFDLEASSTAKLIPGATWNISYGDGSFSSGRVYTDTVSIGGITVENQAVESAESVSGSFSRNANQDGLVGLAFSNINRVVPVKQKTFFENALEQLAMPVFTANLKKNEEGNYNFGVIDNTEFTGDITFIDANVSRGFWEFTVPSFKVGDTVASLPPHQAIVDTGTTLMLMPDAIVKAYYSAVPSAVFNNQTDAMVFSCSEQLPDFTAVIGDHEAVVPGEFIKFAPIDTDDFATASLCFGGIQSVGRISLAVYGDVFLKAQFVVFHGTENQLGFANKPLDLS